MIPFRLHLIGVLGPLHNCDAHHAPWNLDSLILIRPLRCLPPCPPSGWDDVFDDPKMGWSRWAHSFHAFSLNSGLFYIKVSLLSGNSPGYKIGVQRMQSALKRKAMGPQGANLFPPLCLPPFLLGQRARYWSDGPHHGTSDEGAGLGPGKWSNHFHPIVPGVRNDCVWGLYAQGMRYLRVTGSSINLSPRPNDPWPNYDLLICSPSY